jgi:phosphoglycolate phosphatase
MNHRLAIFDFDGTLADSFPFFARVFNRLAATHGFRAVADDELAALRHFDARRMMRHVGLPAWKLPIVARDFTTLMREHRTEIHRFEGIDAALARLAAAGMQLAVVSSNSEANVRSVLGAANVRRIGQFECGMSIFGKASRIRRVLKRAGCRREEAIYVGDQVTDLEAARAAGVAFGAVAWGYSAIEALQAADPERVFARVADLARLTPTAVTP